MIVTELYKGQGLGNQLWCYVTTRVVAMDRGYDFGIKAPENFKGNDFMNLDFGSPVIGGTGPEGGPPESLPDGIQHYFKEMVIRHPVTGEDITTHDDNLPAVLDNTKVDGTMQDEQYILHRRSEIREWLRINAEYDCYDYSADDTCVINFRGGEYQYIPHVFLPQKYWDDAVRHMRRINPNFNFIVITDDVETATPFFPEFEVHHFGIAKDFAVIRNARYLVLANTSFGWFPAWLNENLKLCIAPKYWWAHNNSDGYWSCGYNITSCWQHLDREGRLQTFERSRDELDAYVSSHQDYYVPGAHSSPDSGTLRSGARLGLRTLKARVTRSVRRVLRRLSPSSTTARNVEYRKRFRVYDCFYFFGELDILEIRLNVLDPYVDYFVIVESTETFTGLPKPLVFEEHRDRFERFAHKIIYHVTSDSPDEEADLRRRLDDENLGSLDREIICNALTTDNVPRGDSTWLREFYQKECLKRALVGLSGDDFVLVSDVDEIWNPQANIDFSRDDLFKYRQVAYYYYLDNRSNDDWVTGWTGTVATKYRNIEKGCVNHLRTHSKNTYTILNNGGWHFTFQGGVKQIERKLKAYGHQEFNVPEITSGIEEAMAKNRDYRGRELRFWVDESGLPDFIVENRSRYSKSFRPEG